jgi:hypothetical protein
MKGLKEYIKKHGKHFTEELAYVATEKYWDAKEIDAALQKKVYYNVSGYTKGDIIYIFNGVWEYGRGNKKERADFVRSTLGDAYYLDVPTVFTFWAESYGKNFDFTPYI